jgi:pimeloyl-ACP methyl ester carboxylesterase
VFDVADSLEFERFHLVGHDWGAVVGWLATAQQPERIRSWSALSIPHAGVVVQAMQDDLPVYIDFFNIPWMADAIFSFNGLQLLGLPGLPDGDDSFAALSEPGALKAAIHGYRGLRPSLPAAASISLEIHPPTLFIGGTQDYWTTRSERAQQAAFIKGSFVEMDLDAGHYLMAEQPEVVIEAITQHLKRADTASPS